MTNRLARESSPYLLQHAHNPVDWYPWGDEALARARSEDRPIFLSVGYSACHWCHVMAHESFEDEGVASILNEHFVSIKVDREERPDLDRIYMAAVQALTGSGGWPMSVFLMPDGRPFYGGTYFPPTARYGMPSFSTVLLSIAQAWQTRRSELEVSGKQITDLIRKSDQPDLLAKSSLEDRTLSSAMEASAASFDTGQGGWGAGPKFPQPMLLEFLLRYHHRTGRAEALRMVTQTLDAMARGGIYDQIGGGFHRYAVDGIWLVPHFEKMLYDNAQLARVYLHAWQLTGVSLYRAIVEETLDYVVREMTDPQGGFYATQDADSDGEEGKFFLWTPEEIRDLLGDDAERFLLAYGVTEAGNFEGRNILSLQGADEDRAGLSEQRGVLLKARGERVRPSRDDKVVLSWNGLMLAAFAEAACALQRDDYMQVAERNARFLLGEMHDSEGRLLHVWKDGRSRLLAYLDDHADLADGLLALHQATLDDRWYLEAVDLADRMIDRYAAKVGFYDTGDDHEELILRPRERQDNAVPSGNAMTAWVLLRLTHLSHDLDYGHIAGAALSEMAPMLAEHPLAFGQWLIAADYALAETQQVAIIGAMHERATTEMLEIAREGYHPHRLLALGVPGDACVPLVQAYPRVQGRAATYVCNNMTCHAPVTDPQALAELLAQNGGPMWVSQSLESRNP